MKNRFFVRTKTYRKFNLYSMNSKKAVKSSVRRVTFLILEIFNVINQLYFYFNHFLSWLNPTILMRELDCRIIARDFILKKGRGKLCTNMLNNDVISFLFFTLVCKLEFLTFSLNLYTEKNLSLNLNFFKNLNQQCAL